MSVLASNSSNTDSLDITFAGACPAGFICLDGTYTNPTYDSLTIYRLSPGNYFTIEGKSAPYTVNNIILAECDWTTASLIPTGMTSINPVISMNNNGYDSTTIRNNLMQVTVAQSVAAVMEEGYIGRFWFQGTSIILGDNDPLIQAAANSQIVVASGNQVEIFDGASDYTLRSFAVGTKNKYNFNELTFHVSEAESLANADVNAFGAQIITNDLYLGSVVGTMTLNVQFDGREDELTSQILEYAATTYLDDSDTENRLIKLIRVKADENNVTSMTINKTPTLNITYSSFNDADFSPRVYISGSEGETYAATVPTNIQGTKGYALEIDKTTIGQKGVYLNISTNGTSNIELLPIETGRTVAFVISNTSFKNSAANDSGKSVNTLLYGTGGFVYDGGEILRTDGKFAVTELANTDNRITGEVEVKEGVLKIASCALGSDTASTSGQTGYVSVLKLDEGAALYTDTSDLTSKLYQEVGSLIIAKSYAHDEDLFESVTANSKYQDTESSGLHLAGNRIDITGYDYNNPNSDTPLESSIISRYQQEEQEGISSIWSLDGVGTLGIREADVVFEGDNLKLSGTVLLEKGSQVTIDSEYALGSGTVEFTTEKTAERFSNRNDIATLIIDTSAREGSLAHSGNFRFGTVIDYDQSDYSEDTYVGRIEIRDIDGEAFSFAEGSRLNHEVVLGNASLTLTESDTSLLENSKLILKTQSQLNVIGEQSVRQLVIGADESTVSTSDIIDIDFGELEKTDSGTVLAEASGTLNVEKTLTINSEFTACVSVDADLLYNSTDYIHLLALNQSVKPLETLIYASSIEDGAQTEIATGTVVGNVTVESFNAPSEASDTEDDLSSSRETAGEYFVQNLYDDETKSVALAQLYFTGDLIVGSANTVDLGVQLKKVEINDGQTIQISQAADPIYTKFTAQITESGTGSVAVSVGKALTIDNPENAFSGELSVTKTEGSNSTNAVLIVGSSGSLGSETEHVGTVSLGSGTSLQLAAGVQQSVGDISLSGENQIIFGTGSKLSLTDFSAEATDGLETLLSAVQYIGTASSDTANLYTLSVNGRGQSYLLSSDIAQNLTGMLELSNLTMALGQSDEPRKQWGLTLGENATLKISDSQHSVDHLVLNGGTIVTETSVYSFSSTDKADGVVGLTVNSSLTIDSVSFEVHLAGGESALDSYMGAYEASDDCYGDIFDQVESGKFLTLLNVVNGDFEFDPNKISVDLYLNDEQTPTHVGAKSGSSETATDSDLTTEKVITDETGATKYTYTYGLGLSHDENGIYLGYELTQIDIAEGNVLSIDDDGTKQAKAERLEVLLIGEGGIEIGSNAASVTLSNSGNSFKGTTSVESNAHLILGSDNALGQTCAVELGENATLTVGRFSQEVGALTLESAASLTVGNTTKSGGSFSVSGNTELSGNAQIAIIGENSQLNLNGGLSLKPSQDSDSSVGPNIAIGEKSALSLTLTSDLTVENANLLSGNGTFNINGNGDSQTLYLNASNEGWSGKTVIAKTDALSVVMNQKDSLGTSAIEVNANGQLTLAWDSGESISLFENPITGDGLLEIDVAKVKLTSASAYSGTVNIDADASLYISADSYFDEASVIGNGQLHIMTSVDGQTESMTLDNIGRFAGTVVVEPDVALEVSQSALTYKKAQQRKAAARTVSYPSYEIKAGASLLISGTASSIMNEGSLKLHAVDGTAEEDHKLTVDSYTGVQGSSILFNIVQKEGETAVSDVLSITGQASGQSSVAYNCESEDATLDGLLLVEYASAVNDYLSETFRLDPSHTKLALGAEYFMLVPVQGGDGIANFDYGLDVSDKYGYMLLNLATAENLIERLEYPERFDADGNRIVSDEEESFVEIADPEDAYDEDSTASEGSASPSQSHTTASVIYRPEIGAYLATYLAPSVVRFSYSDHDIEAVNENGVVKQQNAWIKQVGQHRHFKSGANQIKTHASLGATTIGVDLLSAQLTDKLSVKGGLVGSGFYGRSRSSSIYGSTFDITAAKSKTTGYAGGLYMDLIGKAANCDRTLWYAEGWLQRLYSKNTVTSETVGKEKFHGNGWLASLEAGVNLPIYEGGTDNALSRLSIEPKVQLIYEGIRYGTYKETTGTRVKANGTDNLNLRLGGRVGSDWKLGASQSKLKVYADVYWNHSNKPYAVTMNANRLAVQGARNTVETDIGAELTVKNKVSAWIKAGMNRGSDGFHEEHAVIGLKYRF